MSADGIRLDACVHEPAVAGRGTVVLVHGITVDMDEGGMFVRLADRLADAGWVALRFSFRGHGASSGSQRGVTIAGEMLDLDAAVDTARTFPGPLSIVAASFGAVSVSLLVPYLTDSLAGLVLWNPVLDLRHTFIEPTLPWGLENYSPAQQKRLHDDGFLLIDSEFELGRVMFEEMKHYQPADRFAAHTGPALIIHGDQDSYVSYDIARQAATRRPACDFHTIAGSDHGFDTREQEDEAIDTTVSWLTRHHATP